MTKPLFDVFTKSKKKGFDKDLPHNGTIPEIREGSYCLCTKYRAQINVWYLTSVVTQGLGNE